MLNTGTEEKIAFAAAAHIASNIFKSVKSRGFCSLVLAGGNSPRKLYRLLAKGVPLSSMQEQRLYFPGDAIVHSLDHPFVLLPWKSIMLFWGDERCVPENHADSNYNMAYESLIAAIDIPKQNIFPMPHVIENYDTAASRYERKLKSFFEKHKQGFRNFFPVFDVVILGMGPDGHTASLFPGNRNVLKESNRWVIPVHAPQGSPPGYRLTLTLPVINNANNVIFFVTGENKENVVYDITSGRQPDLPAAMVKPEHGELIWFYGKG